MFKKVICFCMSIALCVVSVACSNSKLCDLWDYSTATVLNDEEYTKIKEYILNIEFTTPDLPYLSQFDMCNAKDEVEYMSQIEIQGIPMLLDVLQEIEAQYYEYDGDSGSWRNHCLGISDAALCVILHATDYHCMNFDDSHNTFRETFGHDIQGLKANLSCFFLTAQSEIPKILELDENISSQFPKLARFGILAIPYILPEIENGKTEYEDYFTYIGLHHSVEDFIEIIKTNFDEEHWEELQQDENYTKGAEDFDYKQWLDENADDIRALLKYIDEYTAEFKDIA